MSWLDFDIYDEAIVLLDLIDARIQKRSDIDAVF